MCGIAGIVNLSENQPVDKNELLAMCNSMLYRGPDDGGVYVKQNIGLGNRRLAIIDLSPAGHQPMSNEDGSIWITFNGEIYNFPKLRAVLENKGHQFRSNTDTEVIIHAYEEYGPKCLEMLNGMFALAIWDSRERVLLLARDRVGIKPLYYYFDGQKLLFASEMQLLLRSGQKNLCLDIDSFALNQYLIFGNFPAPYTIFKHVRKLRAGHYLTLKQGQIKIEPYWKLKHQPIEEASEAALLEELDVQIRASVQRRLISDVPVGAFLSGGVDSTCVVGVASQLTNAPLKTFSIGYKDEQYDESRYARQVAAYFGTDHHEMIIEEEADLSNDIQQIMGRFDEPFYDHSAIPTYYVSQLAREEVTVVLSGDGGDELFFGYDHLKKRVEMQSRRQKLLEQFDHDNGLVYNMLPTLLLKYIYHGSRQVINKIGGKQSTLSFMDALEYKLYHEGYASWPDYLVKTQSRVPYSLRAALLADPHAFDGEETFLRDILALEDSADPVAWLSAIDFYSYLPDDILVKVDRMSMQHSLEARVPLLDHLLVEFAARVPTHFKYRPGNQKYLLKRYLGSYLIQDPKILALVTRKKHGFRFPLGQYLTGPLKTQVQDSLRSTRFQEKVGINANGVEQALTAYYDQKRGGKTVWLLYCLYLWWQNNLAE